MKKNNSKTAYNAPAVETLSVRVEAGMQTSGGNPNTTRYDEDSWDTPSPAPNNGARQYT